MPYATKIAPGKKISLAEIDPNDDGGLNKEEGKAKFAQLNAELDVLQEELFAAGTHSVLMVLQGMDTSGKDGTIRSVMLNLNPQGCQVTSFKVPTADELAHDFLWRVHRAVPPKGMVGVFNRSHYEDVLVVRVHGLAPKDVWKARYEQINQFEALLAATGTIVLKFFLHISKDEQEQRLVEREQDRTKAWKLSAGDWRERERWADYQEAYEDALRKCSTKAAPWYVVPANKKWFRNLAVSQALVDTLGQYRSQWHAALDAMSQVRLQELAEFRAAQQPAADSAS
jgi:PPK2 family polyphosphate:nucleotide phosphotransferase